MTDIVEHSKTAWEIASRYSGVLASETRDLAAAIDRALADERLRAASEWRDISTAPRDGSHFWAVQHGTHYECWWYDDWPRSEGYWMDGPDSEPEPTHWMPLPTPPQRNEVKK